MVLSRWVSMSMRMGAPAPFPSFLPLARLRLIKPRSLLLRNPSATCRRAIT